MANHGCNNGRLDDTKYSSPVPVIGLYIAAASLVCTLLMIYDIIAGFRSRKRWLPCKSFSLNSFTLSLLSIASKLPVDLTTQMPSTQDQLTKLCGTTLICISMGFLMPSLGTNSGFESLTNMAAMSILVITILVNICMQMFTGVVLLFVVEHIIILCCMMVLLALLWFSALDINSRKEISIDQNKALLAKGKGSMLERIKLCYIYGYNSNPQFIICKHPNCTTVGGLCLVCSVVLIQAVFRSLILKQTKFCVGTSAYGWSIWPVVFIQILMVIVGSSVTTFRWLALFNRMNRNWILVFEEEGSTSLVKKNSILGHGIWEICGDIMLVLILIVVWLVQILVVIPSIIAFKVLVFVVSKSRCHHILQEKHDTMEEYKDLIQEDGKGFDEWTLSNSVEDMKKWIKLSKSESPVQLFELLSRTPHSQRLVNIGVGDLVYPNQEVIEVSSLSMVLLVRIAEVSLPRNFSASLVKTFSEAFGIIHFIDNRINPACYKGRNKSQLAKAVWKGIDFRILLPIIFEGYTYDAIQSVSDYDLALLIITGVKDALPPDLGINRELDTILDFISRRTYLSVEDLYHCIQQLFVDMLHVLLAQLPNAIFKEVTESPAEEYEERIRLALKLLCKIELLDGQVEWSFPVGSNISSLTALQVDATQSQNDRLEEGNNNRDDALLVTEDDDDSDQTSHGDVAIQVG